MNQKNTRAKKSIGYIKALAMTLMLLSCVYVVDAIPSNEIKQPLNKMTHIQNQIDIDQNIYLTKAQLPLLTKAVNTINNVAVAQLIHEIIRVINQKGYVNSKDIQEITNILQLNRISIHAGLLICEGGTVLLFPGAIITGLLLNTYSIPYIGPAVVGNILYPSSISINLRAFNEAHDCFLVGFVGIASLHVGARFVEYSAVVGFACLIILIS